MTWRTAMADLPPDSPAAARLQERIDHINTGLDHSRLSDELAVPNNKVQKAFMDRMSKGQLERIPNTRSQVWLYRAKDGTETYFYTTGADKQVRAYIKVPKKGQVQHVVASDFRFKGAEQKLIDAHWDTAGFDTPEKVAAFLKKQYLTSSGGDLYHDAIARRFGPSSPEADAIWEANAEKGNLFVNKQTGSVHSSRTGELIKPGGGTPAARSPCVMARWRRSTRSTRRWALPDGRWRRRTTPTRLRRQHRSGRWVRHAGHRSQTSRR